MVITTLHPPPASLAFVKLQSTPFLRRSFTVTPLCAIINGNHMAHALTRFTIGLTRPVQIEPPRSLSLLRWSEKKAYLQWVSQRKMQFCHQCFLGFRVLVQRGMSYLGSDKVLRPFLPIAVLVRR
ncbi:hypothetical protein U1Q18_051778 [Sarracenia purpurea var. burkii]